MTTYEDRLNISIPYLYGDGIEIGAGANPNPLIAGVRIYYFDKRTKRELSEYCNVPIDAVSDVLPMSEIKNLFPNGANFLIANHVIEHLSNPIKYLVEWISYVKKNGYLVLSVPHVDFCPDKGRPVVSLEHLMLDYILERDDAGFESREHTYSFIMSWIDRGMTENKDKFQIAKLAHEQAALDENDIHWHSFNDIRFITLVRVASIICGRKINIVDFASPDTFTTISEIGITSEKKRKSLQDIIIVAQMDCANDDNKFYFEKCIIGYIYDLSKKIEKFSEKIKSQTLEFIK